MTDPVEARMAVLKEWFWPFAATSEAVSDSSGVTRTEIQQLCTFHEFKTLCTLHSLPQGFDLLSEASPILPAEQCQVAWAWALL